MDDFISFPMLDFNLLFDIPLLLVPCPSTSKVLLRQEDCYYDDTFTCRICNRSFSRKYDVQRHIRVHTGMKPYSCPCCQKRFSRSDARIRHFRIASSCKDGQKLLRFNKK